MPSARENCASDAMTAIAVDYWKLLRVVERIMAALPEEKRTRIAAQLRFSTGRLDSHLASLNMSLPTFEGQVFSAELPAMAINADEFAGADILIIDSAIDPAVILNGKVIQNARVMLKEREANVSGN